MQTKRRKAITGVAAGVFIMAAASLFYLLDPSQNAIFPHCPFLITTGYECPGCGTQRALHQLLHFHFKQAFSYNALLPLLIPYIGAGAYIQFFSDRSRTARIEKILFGTVASIIVCFVIVIYWVARNL